MLLKISREESEKLNKLKELDIQQCDFCKDINFLNLGWEPFKELYCLSCEEKHVLCLRLCYKAALNVLGCELYEEVPKVVQRKEVAVNQEYYKARCYLCSKELSGAGKHGVVKNRNNPSFWGIKSEWKILCLGCISKKYYEKLKGSKKKTFNKYLKRGYV